MLCLLAAIASLVALTAKLTLLSLLTIVIYRLFFHPLSKVPGPKLAAISNIWQGTHARNGATRRLGQSLHQKYGPIVRVGPNEVWFNSAAAYKKIYSTQPCDFSSLVPI